MDDYRYDTNFATIPPSLQSQSSQADMVQLQLRKGQLFVCNATWLANQEVKLELQESCRQRQESILGLAVRRSYHHPPP